MIERNVALIAETKKIRPVELKRVEKVLRKRMQGDVAPIWEISATVQVYEKVANVPPDAWPVVVRENIGQPGAISYHSDKNGTPFTMVAHSESWPFFVSHDLVEMLVDPFGNRFQLGPDPRPNQSKTQVRYLVEVCDPCAAATNGYEIDGIRVADFCTPNFYDAKGKRKARYSFTGAVTKPFQVLPDGYITWQEVETGRWWQKLFLGGKVTVRDLGILGGNEAESAVRRHRVSMQMMILRQIQEAYDPSAASVQFAIEDLIRVFGVAR